MRALLLLAFGGPRTPDEVEPFLTRLFRGRKPSPEQIERVKGRYCFIGGCSPLLEITLAQAEALERKLSEDGYLFKSYIGMRYNAPLIEDTLKEILGDGLHEVIAIPMTPFRSRAITGAYIEEVRRAQHGGGETLKITFLEGWHVHPVFIEAVREKIREGLLGFDPDARKRVHLLFTAHSLPRSIVEKDPYVQDMEASVSEIMKGLDPFPWRIAFQSKGGGPEEWIGPEVERVLEDLESQKVKEVLLVPIGFVSDHIEILYDIDILFRRKAESMGILLKRTRSLNASERFIEALACAVEETLNDSENP